MDREVVIRVIVRAEWNQFQRVNNEGGRASCQDDWETFEIMRKSQFMAWEKPVLESYMKDLQEADERGWNLITEKYMRMMILSEPERSYPEFLAVLPERSEERLLRTDELVSLEVRQAEAFAQSFPNLSMAGRNLHAQDDSAWETSYETYLRGELLTYSDATFDAYKEMVERYDREGRSMTYLIKENMVHLYGYRTLEEAERRNAAQR